MDISWDDAQTFLAIAEGGSISAGATRLGLGQPTVSRRIASLEARLGAALFVRSKQGVVLTEAGARLQPAAEQMARWAGEFERLARGAEERATGIVRVAAPPAMAVDLLAPLAARITDEHPGLRLEILASVDHVDLVRGEADLALRTRSANEPELMTLASGESELGVFASEAYRDRLWARRANAGSDGAVALGEIDWVTWGRPYEHVEPRPLLERAIEDFEPSFTSDDFLVLRAAVRAGLGAMFLDRRGAAASGLVEIDIGVPLPPNRFGLVCAKSMQFVPRVRVVADRIIATARELASPGSSERSS